MVKVIWSPLSRNNLQRIFDYIATDSTEMARKFTSNLVKQVKILEIFRDYKKGKIPEDLKENFVNIWMLAGQLVLTAEGLDFMQF